MKNRELKIGLIGLSEFYNLSRKEEIINSKRT